MFEELKFALRCYGASTKEDPIKLHRRSTANADGVPAVSPPPPSVGWVAAALPPPRVPPPPSYPYAQQQLAAAASNSSDTALHLKWIIRIRLLIRIINLNALTESIILHLEIIVDQVDFALLVVFGVSLFLFLNVDMLLTMFDLDDWLIFCWHSDKITTCKHAMIDPIQCPMSLSEE